MWNVVLKASFMSHQSVVIPLHTFCFEGPNHSFSQIWVWMLAMDQFHVNILSPAYVVCGNVMFSVMSVCLSVHRRGTPYVVGNLGPFLQPQPAPTDLFKLATNCMKIYPICWLSRKSLIEFLIIIWYIYTELEITVWSQRYYLGVKLDNSNWKVLIRMWKPEDLFSPSSVW